MSDERALSDQILAEFKRLRLNLDESPYQMFGGEPGGALRFLDDLRRMEPGATWRDVFPEMPAHWVPGRPETWTSPHRPYGPYDYQERPAGPAVHVAWPKGTEADCLLAFLAAARDAGWPAYGGGFLAITNPAWRTVDAMIILDRDTTEEQLSTFMTWVEAQPGVELRAVPRGVGET